MPCANPVDRYPATNTNTYGLPLQRERESGGREQGSELRSCARLFDQKLRAHLRLDIKWTLKYFPSARSIPRSPPTYPHLESTHKQHVEPWAGTSEINVMKQLIDRHIRTLVLWSTDMTKIYDYHVSGSMRARK